MLRSVWVSSADVACRETLKVTRKERAATLGIQTGTIGINAESHWRRYERTAASSSHLIQQDDLGGFQNGPGNSYPLLLSSTQLQASFTHLCFISCRDKSPRNGNKFERRLQRCSEHRWFQRYLQERSWFYHVCQQLLQPPPPLGHLRWRAHSGCCSEWCHWKGRYPEEPRQCGCAVTPALPGERRHKAVQNASVNVHSCKQQPMNSEYRYLIAKC